MLHPLTEHFRASEPCSAIDICLHCLLNENRRVHLLQAATLKGEAPPGLPLKGAGQDSSDAQPKVSTC